MNQDEQLARRCFAPERDDSACAELFRKYKRIALWIARGILYSIQDAEEAVQNTWLSLLKKEEFKHFSNFRAYFLKAVKNHALMIIRKHEVRHHDEHDSLDESVRQSDPESDPRLRHELVADDQEERLREDERLKADAKSVLLPLLGPRHYQAFALVHHDGLTQDEAARLLGYSKKTIQRICKEAIDILRDYDLF